MFPRAGRTRPWVLITDAQERWAVTAARSLRRTGLRVAMAADTRPAVGHASRHCDARLHVPDPHAAPDAFARALETALSARAYELVLPCGDGSLLALARHRPRIEPLLPHGLGLPPRDVVEAAMDKGRLVSAAAAAGLDCPRTTLCARAEGAPAAAARLGYPVAVKPRRSVLDAGGAAHRQASTVVRDPAELAAVLPRFGEPVVLQEHVVGDVHSCAGVRWGGRLVALALARYVRTWPPEAGNAAFAETVALPAGLPARVDALLGDVGWEGVFELELLRTADGTFVAIDLNPRPYGSLALAVRAGADLPSVWAACVRGVPPAPVTAAAGVRYRWEDAELRRFALELRRGRWRTAAAVARPRRATAHPHLRWDDPGPMVARAAILARTAVSRAADELHARDSG